MNTIPAFRAAPAPSRRPEPSRTDDVRIDDDRDDTRNDKRTSASTSPHRQFSALLALLAGAGPRVRAELLKQVPTEGSGLVDRLLEGAGDAAALDAGTDALSTDDGAKVSDAMRYGQIMRSDQGMAHADDARAAAMGRVVQSTQTPAERILARMADRRGATVEQLLAMGDEQGAELRSALDRILDNAGTDSGTQLAMLGRSGLPAAAAIAAANAASARDVSSPVKDPEALVPEFRSRLDRVIARMKSEYGHDVEIVETTRSQERQDFLFAQGRSRPGPVVTWTQNSPHARGEAADLLVDGKWNNTEGYTRLQRIAQEEGLGTLGMTDPGHLQLQTTSRMAQRAAAQAAMVAANSTAASSATAEGTTRAGSAAVATAAGASGVAQVAGVAGVARVASGAPAGAAVMTLAASTASLSRGQDTSGRGDTSGEGGGRSANSNGSSSGRKLGQSMRTGHDHADSAATTPAYGQLAGPAAGAQTGTNTAVHAGSTMPSSRGAAGADATQRATDVQDLRESTPGSISRLTLSVDGVDGGDDRITIDLRGRTVGTQITTDAATADGLRARTGELQDALSRHGLESDRVQISNAGKSSATRGDAGDAVRTPSMERDALRMQGAQQGNGGEGAAGNGQRERSAAGREWDKQESARDEARENARENAREDARKARDEQRDEAARRRGQQHYFNGNS